MENKPKKLFTGTLERIVEVGTPSYFSWGDVPRGGRGSPRTVHGSSYSVLLLSTKDGEKEQRYEGIVLPDSIGHSIEVYTLEQTVRTPAKIQLHDKDLNRWYR